MTRSPVGAPLPQRIARLTTVAPDGCWLWEGRVTACGYGQMSMPGARKEYAHRVAYRAFCGEIPAGFAVDHLCRVKRCVNPEHLEAVSYSENTRRWWSYRKAEAAS